MGWGVGNVGCGGGGVGRDIDSKASQEVGRFGCAKTFVQCIGKFTDALEESN